METRVSNQVGLVDAPDISAAFANSRRFEVNRAANATEAESFPACKVELRFPHDDSAEELAQKLQRIFESCSFECEMVRELSSPARGVRVESHEDAEHVAALIYDAFASAGIRATFSSHPKTPADTIVVHIGRSDVV